MKRFLSVDYGHRRIGLAASDELGITVQGLRTLQVKGPSAAVSLVARVAVDRSVDAIVVGLPLNMDGSRGPMALAAESFARELGEETGLPVACWDERLTSAAAKRSLDLLGVRSPRRQGEVDRIAATLLLEGYLRAHELGDVRDSDRDAQQNGGRQGSAAFDGERDDPRL